MNDVRTRHVDFPSEIWEKDSDCREDSLTVYRPSVRRSQSARSQLMAIVLHLYPEESASCEGIPRVNSTQSVREKNEPIHDGIGTWRALRLHYRRPKKDDML